MFLMFMLSRRMLQRRPVALQALKGLRPTTNKDRSFDDDLPLMNDEIVFPELRVMIDRADQPDEILGIIPRSVALEKATELGVDLVVIAEQAVPPVAKIVDYGKLRYQKEKKKKEQLRKSKNEIKEVKMSYKIGSADYMVRRRAASKFIAAGNRVKVFVQFRGREQQHMSLGDDIIAKLVEELASDGTPVAKTKTVREGRDLTTILSPK